jgi:phytoene dehydrogenase-like protein
MLSGEELSCDAVVSCVHPKLVFGKMVDRQDLGDEFMAGIDQWKSRSGTVKVNVAVDRLVAIGGVNAFDPKVHGWTIVLAESLDDIEGAFQDAVAGRCADKPFADICIPSVFDDSLAPDGHHVVSMFTQWVPDTYAVAPDQGELDLYVARLLDRVETIAPGFNDSIVGVQVRTPYDMEHEYGLVGGNIFHGELSAAQMFHMRPVPGWADHTTPVTGLYQGGSATHGGGGVCGLPALAATKRLVADLKRRRR